MDLIAIFKGTISKDPIKIQTHLGDRINSGPTLALNCSFLWGHIGIMENQMETTIEYWGYIGIVEKKMETTSL